MSGHRVELRVSFTADDREAAESVLERLEAFGTYGDLKRRASDFEVTKGTVDGNGWEERWPDIPEVRLLAPDAWCDEYGLEVVDPDGWRRDRKPWTEPITLPDFWKRFGGSTCRMPPPDVYERVVSDVRAASGEG